MAGWLEQLGHEDAINRLTFIHVAGSKGKGSTCAYIDSLLRAHSKRTGYPAKTGLYTSPHLIDETERIRISGHPISHDLFAKYAWEVIDALSMNPEQMPSGDNGPGFLQSMFLISLHAFVAEKVDVAVIEVHTGGRFCATNFIQHPAITAITTLLLDHTPELGNDIESVTWHKAGIFKKGASAFSTNQVPEAMKVLEDEARKEQVNLEVVGTLDNLRNVSGFNSAVQRQNFSLAWRVCTALLSPQRQHLNDEDIHTAVAQVDWPGRFQVLSRKGISWYLDVAHSAPCIDEPVKWYKRSSQTQDNITRIVVFAHIANPRRRDGAKLLTQLVEAIQCISIVPDYVFLTKDKTEDVPALLEKYKAICDGALTSQVEIEPSVQKVLDRIEAIEQQSQNVHVLVTGSVFLVGDVLRLLDYEIN
uniref:tetrahydrofolate synthase n=1 Tax=Bionectria ochroleuca TaxID=29856 RepID=A0A8H7TQG7_BIOOC